MNPPLSLKVHDLVALMSVAIGHRAHHTNRHNEIPLGNVTGGILDYDEGKMRTFPILDALAGICVSDPEKQVVALGLQVKLGENKLCLTIAENEKVKAGLVGYLHQVWGILRAMSFKFRANRSTTGKTAEWLQYRRVSPNIPDDIAWDTRIRLFRQVYLYTRAKNQHRVKKWWDPLAEFMERFYASESQGGELSERGCDLDFAFRALTGAYKHYDSKLNVPQNDQFWESFYALFEEATCSVTRITQDYPFFCPALVSVVGRFSQMEINVW